MSEEEVDPKKESVASLVPPGWENKVPARAGGAVRALHELSSKDRRAVLRAFGQRGIGAPGGQQSMMMASAWSGPLPPPDALARYNEVLPNGAERIVALVERQSSHRMDIESHVARQQVKQSGRGQIFALVIGLAGLATAAYVAKLGMGAAAGTIATVALGTLAVTFILGKRSEAASRAGKDQPGLPPPPQPRLEVTPRPGSEDPPL